MPNDYGTDLVVNIVHEDDKKPTRVAIVEHHGKVYLEIRSMYRVADDDKLHFGKGVRLLVDDATDVLLCAESTLVGYLEMMRKE